MKLQKFLIILEFFIIFIYLFTNLFSIIIFPINIILGFLCILFLPGFNLLNLIRPNSNLIEKLGYSTFFSLALDTTIMFIIYVGFYNYVQKSGRYAFIFWHELLIIIIQILNISLILLNIYINKNRVDGNKTTQIINDLKESINLKDLLIIIGFIVSLIFLCLSVFLSKVEIDDLDKAKQDYLYLFTFFTRVPVFFYIFLAITIIILVYILFFIKNKYLMLSCVSIFLYCLWILPYLQLKGYISHDMNMLKIIYENYLIFGIHARSNCSFVVYIQSFLSIRYSTSLFTSILITFGFNVDIDTALMFLYPLIFIFTPYIFYSIFQKFSKNKNGKELYLRILMILVISSTSFIRSARTATTGIIGTVIFIILILEFFKFVESKEKKLREVFLIIFLYFFLTLTHLEECVYFLMLIPSFTICYLFLKLRESPKDEELLASSRQLILIMGSLLLILSIIFILLQEFFCAFDYFFFVFKEIPILQAIYYIYMETRVVIFPILEGNYRISPIIIGLTIVGIGLPSILLSLFASKFFHFLNIIYDKLINIMIKIQNFLKKLISMKSVQVAIPIIIFSVIVLMNLFYPFLELEGLMVLVEIILSYSIITLYIFLFVKGIPYYKAQNNKQNYFLILIIILFVFLVFLIFGDIDLAYYHLNSRIVTYFVFFNLMIIQNNYFLEFINKKNKYLIILIILLLSLASFYSLRKLSYG